MWVQKVPGGGVEGLAFAPDGRTLYVVDAAHRFSGWDPATRDGRQVFRPAAQDRGVLNGIFTAAGGRYLVVKSYPVRVWDLAAGSEHARVLTHFPWCVLPWPGNDGRLAF